MTRRAIPQNYLWLLMARNVALLAWITMTMNNKNNAPDSDQSVRSNHPDAGDTNVADADTAIPDLQTSNKSGKHSSTEKLAASRPEFGAGRGAQPVPGAFGADESHVETGRLARPDTNQLRCNGCGRYFNTPGELSQHEIECRTAKAATASGRDSLRHEDATPYQPNDVGSDVG